MHQLDVFLQYRNLYGLQLMHLIDVENMNYGEESCLLIKNYDDVICYFICHIQRVCRLLKKFEKIS